MRNHNLWRGVALLCLLSFVGCNEGTNKNIASGQVVAGQPTTVTVNGPGASAVVELPADALPDGATVVIGVDVLVLPAGVESVSPTVGVGFSDPIAAGDTAKVTFTYEPCLVNLQGKDAGDIRLFRKIGNVVDEIDSKDFDVDPDDRTITTEITVSLVLLAAVEDGDPDPIRPFGGMALHGIALDDAGGVWTWGWNGFGQLGDGTTTLRNFAAPVFGLDDIVSVEAGEDFSLALRGDGRIWAWGANYGGQLGDGTFLDSAEPVPLRVLPCFVEIAVGAASRSTLALSLDGELWAWGKNEFGQLGNGTTIDAGEPVKVLGVEDPANFAIGGHALAVTQDGKVLAWGGNDVGQLGDGTLSGSTVPVQVQDLDSIVAVAVGAGFSLALRNNGTVWAWGANNQGQLGRLDIVQSSAKPVQIAGLNRVVAIDAMGRTGMALDADGRVWTWGAGPLGQLGIEIFTLLQFVPMPVDLPMRAIDIDGGNDTAIVLLEDGSYYVWGDNALGQLADGDFLPKPFPIRVDGPGK
jgi:alpha-tubulin suppressor-like RCC1 family protein